MQSVVNSADDSGATYASLAGKLDASLLKAVEVMGFENMTAVQHEVLQALQPDWRNDCLVQAKTGTGKTVAFLLPALHNLLRGEVQVPKGDVAVLIITPTRELAQQIAQSCNALTSQLTGGNKIECHTAVGGTAKEATLNKFMKGDPKVLVATPGRLEDYLSDGAVAKRLQNVRTIVLDEADTMLEVGFLGAVKNILAKLPSKAQAGWQGMCFSATLPEKVKEVVNVVLKDGYHHISTVDPNETPTHERVPQFSLTVRGVEDTFTGLLALLSEEIADSTGSKKIIVFGATAHLVGLMSDTVGQALKGVPVSRIHSRLSQAARTRTVQEFREAKQGVLFASDVVGRGLDFPNVDLVIQVGAPPAAAQYVHRVGRTGRAGNDGRAVILLHSLEAGWPGANPEFRIQPHPRSKEILARAADPSTQDQMRVTMRSASQELVGRAYQSYIGYLFGLPKLLKMMGTNRPGVVQLANAMAIKGMYLEQQPALTMNLVSKLDLKGVPGVIVTANRPRPVKGPKGPKEPKTAPPAPKPAAAKKPKSKKVIQKGPTKVLKPEWGLI
ncbi:DEAD-domain-containing protein [Aspergillus homomorphus CBS 101889]|uniref:ATP-dependent RNA helicase n=1 Tax=Aspergillus homomorphus (strain CBS 101889) TaxID=1450537 RepID=A0A395HPH2_ASPHC|nr:DEAD-domain-containing protein [Aspergillus homomorphus CBS 101889]RAL08758.1 DEAD-domain-containing protein [Aspergillus homomorphus CBS 101889]